ncbi:helicase domain-containing protein [Acetobacter tropicalis NRIC 0312]|uniref:RNA helicase n=1 Tax=Acetobacter tropicalis TaxID=104102 RepID=A0A511FR22_9PROT|nr:helicase-related protein [Acetobacter tropicalis]KXV50564.1 RNA helicase [Acetobacter tropicalis]GAL97199.1 RNA helicase [Acetobacter tropicalis]GBR71462.1 helicase domain-containing protein [Acetobacter tropicalis NRIC 0312]GEL51402.1 RNA helicase [Acetobacter tropicalis]
MDFGQLQPGAHVRGLDTGGIAEIIQVRSFGPDALNLVFRVSGKIGERLLYRGDEIPFELVQPGRTYAFDADGALLRLVSEAWRLRLAHLFDPYLAITLSRIEALPHQITAVYGAMLPRQPLRFLLADDPGAGKTVMAGLLIKELLIRGDLERCLIVAPGSLVEQWQEELAEKFALSFDLLTRDQVENSVTGNPFAERNRFILRLDMAARSDALQARLEAAPEWDLVICDEAHRMSASYFGGEVKETRRYKLGKLLGARTRNLLLMSATPHNGKEADFQLFMGLLDSDRFEGRFREGVRKADVSDMMRRLTKEELFRFDGTPLFPERRAYTVAYELSPAEADLYQAVTSYVREEMNRADRIGDGQRQGNVGFALQILQRRLASSAAAIHRSLERRRKRLEARLREERLHRDSILRHHVPSDDLDDLDEATATEAEDMEDTIADRATAAATVAELEAEILILRDIEEQALSLKLSGEDTKWRQLEAILDDPIMVDPHTGARRKILIFTEPKDTLEYLRDRIAARTGEPDSVVVIHGGITREARRAAVAAFNSDPTVLVMIANDAAGEGVNLQRGAHLMVNYDLPWNPNRIEQRFGRIHRIGQTEICHLWNLCAANTREGEVYQRLLDKLEEARAALGGKVYDVLGELFEGNALRDLLVEAVRYGDRPEIRARLFQSVENAVDVDAINRLVEERKLTSEGMAASSVAAIRDQMERAEAMRLQPHFVGAFFREAFSLLGGRMSEREAGRFEVMRVPSALKHRDRLIGRGDPVLDRYARVVFDKSLIAGRPQAELLAPGHPLFEATLDLTLERFRPLLQQGAILVDEADESVEPRLLAYLEHAIRDGRSTPSGEPRVISQRLQFVYLGEDGSARGGGPAPYLDTRPATEAECAALSEIAQASWLSGKVEERAITYAIAHLVPAHLQEVRTRRLPEINKIEHEVRARLTREINYWDARAARLREEERAGKDQRINASNAEATAQRLTDRLYKRQTELDRERQISPLSPVLRGAALIIPRGLLEQRNALPVTPMVFSEDPIARAEIERHAMEAVIAAERALGNDPCDVSAEKKGWDIESRDGATGHLRFIEVKGRHADGTHIIVTKNELLASLNSPDAYILAVVRVESGFVHAPVYVRRFCHREPGFGETAVVFDIDDLLGQGTPPS